MRNLRQRLDDMAHWVGLHPRGLCGRTDVPTHLVLGFRYSKFISPARWIPPVKEIKESKKFMDEIQPSQKSFWEKTKLKLLKSSCLPGLDFKYFQPPNICLQELMIISEFIFRRYLWIVAYGRRSDLEATKKWVMVEYSSHQTGVPWPFSRF